ncbi:outer membrane protein assembly factor BamB family protein [Streptomyces antimicrobicus]|uniref:PQQ-binding-like beta-propeller repeat protein n=1 Tax=Streptomyces antimicrobicus TaxID=2883108 RepID=A0ABS8B0S0_9ACTN|nr:PQQ-binding-like beta-propeller repeat protein [Streptomyces antimicrobicus]MCB5178212.1 PQQ-binding-like beta-propeller repeat protein [Streptomyces antimicrobicus]
MIGSVLALALVAGGIVFALTAGSSGSGSSGSGSDKPSDALGVAWQSAELPRSTASFGSSVQWPARWTRGSVLAYGDEHGVRGYDLATGTQKWRVEPPKGAGEPCAMSPRVSLKGVGAVLFDAGGDDCSYLAAVDIDTGSVLWAKKVATQYGANAPQVHVGTKSITVGLNTTESVQTFDVQSGAAADPLAGAPVNCRYSYVFSAEHIVAKPQCRNELVVLDTQYGGSPRTVSDQGGEPIAILNDHPLTVAVRTGEGDSGPPRVLNFDKEGRNATSVNLTGKAAELVFKDKEDAFTEKGLFFGKVRDGSTVVADLTSGKVVWEGRAGSASFIGYEPLGNRVVIAESDPQKAYWTRVGALDPATGKLAYAGTMVMPDGGYLHRSGTLYAYDSGKVVSVGERASDGKRLMVTFTAPLPRS